MNEGLWRQNSPRVLSLRGANEALWRLRDRGIGVADSALGVDAHYAVNVVSKACLGGFLRLAYHSGRALERFCRERGGDA